MKMRIKGDSLRLRLSRSEVAELSARQRVEVATHFGPEPQQVLRYAIDVDASLSAPEARWHSNLVEVLLPADLVEGWADDERVGFEAEQVTGDGRVLALLIEKDFQCLKPRSGEDESDNYPNPQAD